MLKKSFFITLTILSLFTCIGCFHTAKLTEPNVQQTQDHPNDITMLKDKVYRLESLYNHILESAKISLDCSKLATSTVSVSSFIFILISFMLAFFGIKELKGISDIKEKSTRDINLVRHFNLAEMLLKSGQNIAASKEFEEVLKIDPNNLFAHVQLGFLYTDIFKDKAIAHCKKAIEIDPYNFIAYMNWGVNLDHTTAPKQEVVGIYETTEKLGEQQLVDPVSLGKVKRFLAASYEAIGEKGKAIKKYEEAKEKIESAKNSPDLAKIAEYWLKDLDGIIKRLKN